jgi:CRP-like cAMP-binding protein
MQMISPSREHARLITQLSAISHLSEHDKSVLAGLPFRIKTVAKQTDIISEGERPTESCFVLEGLLCRYKLLGRAKRQILSFHLAGDLPDLQSLHLECMDHSLGALTPARIALVPHEELRRVCMAEPSFAAVLARHAAIDGSIFREWIGNIGRRDGLSRVAHLFCEFYVRMRVLGLASDGALSLPLTQAELGDATGLSPVHMNRVMQQLRAAGLIASRGHIHTVRDWDELRRVGEFNAGYLHLKTAPPNLAL